MSLSQVQWQSAGRKKEPAGGTTGSRFYDFNAFSMVFRIHADTVIPTLDAVFSTSSAMDTGILMFRAFVGGDVFIPDFRPAPGLAPPLIASPLPA